MGSECRRKCAAWAHGSTSTKRKIGCLTCRMAFYGNPKRKRGKTRNPSLTLRVTVKTQSGHEASDLPFGASTGRAKRPLLECQNSLDSSCSILISIQGLLNIGQQIIDMLYSDGEPQ